MKEKKENFEDIIIEGDKKKKNSGTTLFIVFALLVIAVVGVLVGSKFMKGADKETVQSNNANMTKAKSLYLDDVIAATKDYYYKNNFVNLTNLEYWNIQKSEVNGYYESELGVVYYLVEGEFKCKDGSSDCVYLEQSDEPKENGAYIFKVYVGIIIETEPYTVKNIQAVLVKDKYVEDKGTIEKVNDELKNSIIESYKSEMIKSNFYIESDVVKFEVDVQYETTINGKEYYRIFGLYSCVDGEADCIYQPQVGDKENGFYPISLYVVGKTNGNEFTYDSVEEPTPIINDYEDEDIFETFKSYYKTNGFVVVPYLSDWTLVNIDLGSGSEFIITSKFKCDNSTNSCIYASQLNDPDSDGYTTFTVNATFEVHNGEYVITSIE